jgi:hypothetical protein
MSKPYTYTLRKFKSKIAYETEIFTDTEFIAFESEHFKIDDLDFRNQVIEYALFIGLQEKFDTPNSLNYESKEGFGYKLHLGKNKAGTLQVKLQFDASFSEKVHYPNEKIGEYQREFLKRFPEATVRITRCHLAKDYLIKSKFWELGIDEIFPCPFRPNSNVDYQRITMRGGRNPDYGFNDRTKGRNHKMTHFRGHTKSQSASDKYYDKTSSMNNLYLKGRITDRYERFLERWGVDEQGRPNRVMRHEVMFEIASLKDFSILLTTARQEGRDEQYQKDLKEALRASWLSEHRMIDLNSIPSNGKRTSAKTNEVFEYISELHKRVKKKKMISELASRHQIDEKSLEKIITRPKPRKTLDTALLALAKQIKLELSRKEIISSYIEEYVPQRLNDLVINLIQEDYRRKYDFYSQKSLIAIDPIEKEFYRQRAETIKNQGYLFCKKETEYYKGYGGEKISSFNKTIEQSLMDTVLTEEEIKRLNIDMS